LPTTSTCIGGRAYAASPCTPSSARGGRDVREARELRELVEGAARPAAGREQADLRAVLVLERPHADADDLGAPRGEVECVLQEGPLAGLAAGARDRGADAEQPDRPCRAAVVEPGLEDAEGPDRDLRGLGVRGADERDGGERRGRLAQALEEPPRVRRAALERDGHAD